MLRLFPLCLALSLALGGCEPKAPKADRHAHHHHDRPVATTQNAQPADPTQLPAIVAASPSMTDIYRWAADHHAELQYIPCACQCQEIGHASNYSCFVKQRLGPGRYVWDDHSAYCQECLDIARDVRRMLGEGRSMAAIRQAIEQQHGPFRMQTPWPPGA